MPKGEFGACPQIGKKANLVPVPRLEMKKGPDNRSLINEPIFYSVRHFFGHFSTQSPHCAQAPVSTVQDLEALSTVIAPHGQFFAQSPQNTQASRSFFRPSPPAGAAPPAAGAAFGAAAGNWNLSVTFSVFGVVYSGFMVRHFFGQFSTHELHWMHCILWISQVRASLSTVIALAGHFFWQIPQAIQELTSISTCPLVTGVHSLGTTGYMRVAGFLNKLLKSNLLILNVAMTLTYLSVQLMHGSIVSTRIGTSARSQPFNI